MVEQELASIKKPNEVNVYKSREEFEYAISEIAKCKRDISYFAEKYFKIINLDTGLTTIRLYNKQKELLDFFTKEKRCIVLASRQSSKTTTYTIFALWLLMFQNEKKIMLLANKADTALEICSRIQMAYQYCPKFLKPGVLIWNKGEIEFSNMSKLKAFATSSDSARGFSANVVIMDEAAFVPNNIASKVFESIYPVISSSKNSQFIMVSTPNGADSRNLYYDIWCKANSKSAEKNTEGWKPFRFDWWDVPTRDEQWKKNTIASIGQQRFDQEFGNQFIVSSTIKKLIPDDVLEQYRMKLSEYKLKGIQPKKQQIVSEKEDEVYEFDMWHEFKPNHAYLASGDVAEGVGSDASVLYIWDVTNTSNITMCAKFSSNSVSLVQFAYIANKILALYCNPPLACERNGVSAGMLDSLRITYGYQNIIIENRKNEAGIFSHVQTKGKACIWARDMMTTKGFGFTIYDKALIDELNIFCKKDTKGVHIVYQALPGADTHDDHVMAFIWACFILNQDRIDQYFTVCENFTSDFGQVLPKTLQSLNSYTDEQLRRLKDDPLYKEFMDFKDEVRQKVGSYEKMMQTEDDNDMFKYRKPADQYFDDFGGEEWNDNSYANGSYGANESYMQSSRGNGSFYII